LLTIGIIGAVVAASVYGGYIDFTPSVVSTDVDDDQSTTNTNTTVVIENPYDLPDGMSIDAASYIIFKNGTQTCAKNGETGYTEFYGSDSASVIQEAIDATESGLIYFKRDPTPSTTVLYDYQYIPIDYTITSGISVPEGISLASDGAVFDMRSFNGTLFTVNEGNSHWPSSQRQMCISGLVIWGDYHNTTSGVGIYINDWAYGIIIDEVKSYFVANPVFLKGDCYNAIIQNCNLEFGLNGITLNATGDGVGPNALKILNNEISNFETAGINGASCSGVTITNNWIESNGIGIKQDSAQISDNYIQTGSGDIGIYLANSETIISNNYILVDIGDTGIEQDNSYKTNAISGNTFYIDRSSGITSQETNLLTITNNKATVAGGSGSFFVGQLTASIISGNQLSGGYSAINISLGSGVSISSNNFYDCDGYGIYAGTLYYSSISSNTFSESTLDLACTDGGSTGNTLVGNVFRGSVNVNAGSFNITTNYGYYG
jgi:hypothetical protein